MKICMLTTSFPRTEKDSAGVFILRLCKALVSSGVVVNVVAPADGGSASHSVIGGCCVNRFTYFVPRGWQKLAYAPGGIPASLARHPWLLVMVPFFILSFFIKTYRVSKGADLIHAQWLHTGLIAWMLRIIRGIPFIVTLHGSDVVSVRNSRIGKLIFFCILKRAAAVTTVSEELQNWVVVQGISKERVHHIRNGVELGQIRIKREGAPFHFLFVGNLFPGKGVRYLIDALSIVFQSKKGIHLTIIGEGEERAGLERRVKEKGVDTILKFVGFQPPDQIPSWMHQSDCLVLPSLSEGTPSVVLEAMACSLPVIASELPGVREIVDDTVTGFLVKLQDVEDLAQKLLAIARNRDLGHKMGEKGRQVIIDMNLGWDQVARRYIEVYHQTCEASCES